MTRFNDRGRWLKPYLDRVRFLLPDGGRRISVVRLVRPPSGYTTMFGTTDEYWDGSIEIRLHSHMRRIVKPGDPFRLIQLPTMNILDTFAHELAHIHHWKHTPGHMKFTCRLMTLFMGELERRGFVSEERSGELFGQ